MVLRRSRVVLDRLNAEMSQKTLDRFFKRPASSGLETTVEASLKTKAPKLEGNDERKAGEDRITEELAKRIERNREEARARLLNRNRVVAPFNLAEAVAAANSQGSTKLETLMGDSWRECLRAHMKSSQFKDLDKFVSAARKSKKIFPAEDQVFNAFKASRFENVRVVILGQDPYHGDRQAHGLCFSVQKGIVPPPSLVNIYKELEVDVPGFKRPKHGYLQKWADQGVLLLNSVLTVEAYKAGSHAGKGWEKFTDEVIKQLSDRKKNVVFLLWGKYAENKGKKIDRKKHHVLIASHPSPLSSGRGGWFGCKHFSKTNGILQRVGKQPIDWNLD